MKIAAPGWPAGYGDFALLVDVLPAYQPKLFSILVSSCNRAWIFDGVLSILINNVISAASIGTPFSIFITYFFSRARILRH
jgi:hypothetical protein